MKSWLVFFALASVHVVDGLSIRGVARTLTRRPMVAQTRLGAPRLAREEKETDALLRLRGAGGKTLPMAVFSVVGGGFAVLLMRTLRTFPIFPFQPTNAAWSYAWLITTICDYYGAALCLCGIALASEQRMHGILWSLSCMLAESNPEPRTPLRR